jgi:ribosomal protein S18 acetylase RimI-like enzyme
VKESHRGRFVVSCDPGRLAVDELLTLLESTHWAGAMPGATLQRAVANSICYGLYDGERLVGFGRAVTDRATYAYLTDVVIHPGYRRQGLGRWLIESILAHPDLQGLRRIALVTRDAEALYRQLGFSTGPGVLTYMELIPSPR